LIKKLPQTRNPRIAAGFCFPGERESVQALQRGVKNREKPLSWAKS
jgi:hypothetical protein